MPKKRPIGPKKSQDGHKIRQKVKVRLQWNIEIILIRIFVPMSEHQYIFYLTPTQKLAQMGSKKAQNGPKLGKNYKL